MVVDEDTTEAALRVVVGVVAVGIVVVRGVVVVSVAGTTEVVSVGVEVSVGVVSVGVEVSGVAVPESGNPVSSRMRAARQISLTGDRNSDPNISWLDTADEERKRTIGAEQREIRFSRREVGGRAIRIDTLTALEKERIIAGAVAIRPGEKSRLKLEYTRRRNSTYRAQPVLAEIVAAHI